MPRIPDAMIERLKREVPLERLAADSGVTLKRRGKDWFGRCPFHDDQTPSLIITPAKNLFHCMGCGAAGSPIDWVMRTQGVDFRGAAERLVKAFFPLAAESCVQPEPLKEKPLDTGSGLAVLLREVVAYYHRCALAADAFWRYLAQRGLDDRAMVDHFKLGYVDRSLAKVLPSGDSKAGASARAALRELGIIRDRGNEHFLGCLVVPVFGENGEVLEIYGRKTAKRQRKDSPCHLYLPGPHRGVWNREGFEGHDSVILCEALLDALTFWHHGFHNVTASYGIHGFTDDHLAAFQAAGIKTVYIAYDGDKAGAVAARKLASRLQGVGMVPRRVIFPKDMDANSFALKVTPASKSLALQLENPMEYANFAKVGETITVEPAKQETEAPPEMERAREAASVPGPAKPKPPGMEKNDDSAMPSLQANLEPAAGSSQRLERCAADGGIDGVNECAAELRPQRTTGLQITEEGEDIHAARGDRAYRVRGLAANTSTNALKVNLLASRGDGFHVDVLNLYSAYQRGGFAKLAARELAVKQDVVEKDLGRLLLSLETLQAERIGAAVKPVEQVALSEAEVVEAVGFLRDPRLLERILADFRACGMIGEETTKLAGYLVATSRKLDQPLGALIQSASAAGKSTAMDAVLAFIPDEDKVKFSAVTGQSLYYMGEEDLCHKVLAIVEEAGAEKASYPLKLLLSEGELTIASTGKNEQTGEHATLAYKVQGPVAVMLTTTAVDTDEEFQNRCLVLAVDETRDQTRAIHQLQRQRRTLAGLRARHLKAAVIRRQQNAQRMLRPLQVVNPFAEKLTFLDTQTRMRRDHQKYLNLIDCIAFLHQYQRPVKTVTVAGEEITYVEAAAEDVAVANRLAAEVLGRTLDELSPQTRFLLLRLHEMVAVIMARDGLDREDVRFTRRQAREFTGWSEFQVRTHMERLQRMEYVLTHRGMRGQSFLYELLYDGEGRDGQPFLMGLIAVESLSGTAPVTEFEHRKPGFEDKERKNEVPTSAQRAENEPLSSFNGKPVNQRFHSGLTMAVRRSAQNAI